MQMPISGQAPLSIPMIKDFLMIISAIALAVAFFLGVCWTLGYEVNLILTHTSSTQMLFMCLIGVGLFHAGRRYLQRGKKQI